jgi:hypothetical protein
VETLFSSLAATGNRSSRLAQQAVTLVEQLRETVAESRNLLHVIRLRRELAKRQSGDIGSSGK